MKTVIFTREAQDDIYNDETVMQKVWNGESAEWKLWFSGDARCRPVQTETGDRFFIEQEGTGIVASGTIGKIAFEPGTSKLVRCGMNRIQLIPDKVGRPVLDCGQISEILSGAKRSHDQEELVLSDGQAAAQLEMLWIHAILENNPGKDQLSDDLWAVDRLHEQTVAAIWSHLQSIQRTCPGCGTELDADGSLFYRPSMKGSLTAGPADSFDELIGRYSILCGDCAAIEDNLHQTRTR